MSLVAWHPEKLPMAGSNGRTVFIKFSKVGHREMKSLKIPSQNVKRGYGSKKASVNTQSECEARVWKPKSIRNTQSEGEARVWKQKSIRNTQSKSKARVQKPEKFDDTHANDKERVYLAQKIVYTHT